MRKDKSGVVLRGPSWPPAWDEEAGEVKSGRQTTATPRPLCIAPISRPHIRPQHMKLWTTGSEKACDRCPDSPRLPGSKPWGPRSGPKGNVRMGGVGGWRPSSLSASLPQGFWALLPEASLP